MSDTDRKLKALLVANEEDKDSSLQGLSLKRALSSEPPTTLTPYEWEQWYKDHGIPAAHQPGKPPAQSKPWWRRWW